MGLVRYKKAAVLFLSWTCLVCIYFITESQYAGTVYSHTCITCPVKRKSLASLVNPCALQRTTNTENLKQIFPEKELRSHGPNIHIHVSVSNLYIPTIDLSILLEEICGPILGIYI
jgi:hypothetical protein